MSFNVPAVYDVNGGIKGLAKQDHRRLCGGEKLHKGRSPTAVFRNPSRFSGEA
jgi:hypothetical protein